MKLQHPPAILSIVCAFTLAGRAQASRTNQWIWRNPLPAGNNLSAAAYGANQFVAIGFGGAILQSGGGQTEPTLVSGGPGRFTLNGLAGTRFSVQVSTNLARWVNLTKLVPAGPSATFADPSATSGAPRFYRVVVP